MSSAFYLEQALSLSAKLAQAPVDMAALLGGEEVLQKRLEDLTRWQKRSGNALLLFLKGYVQLKMGDSQAARKSLETAQQLQPELVSIQTLLAGLGD